MLGSRIYSYFLAHSLRTTLYNYGFKQQVSPKRFEELYFDFHLTNLWNYFGPTENIVYFLQEYGKHHFPHYFNSEN